MIVEMFSKRDLILVDFYELTPLMSKSLNLLPFVS